MPDNKQTAKAKILKKWHALKKKGLDLGPATSDVLNAGYGGWYQSFRKGRIYSHHSVGTYEVHGNILKIYLSRQGPGHNPKIGRREFGFPTSDEQKTPDGLYPMSQFEWGQIIAVPGTRGGVALSGAINKAVSRLMPTGNIKPQGSRVVIEKLPLYRVRLGNPINGNVTEAIAIGEVAYFERAIVLYHPDRSASPQEIYLNFPLLGQAAILKPSSKQIPLMIEFRAGFFTAADGYTVLNFITFKRFFLQKVGTTKRIQLKLQAFPNPLPNTAKIPIGFEILSGEPLEDRTLYDIVFKMDNGWHYPLSPHSIYVKASWENFGLIHATDIHVSKRIDGFRRKLHDAKTRYKRDDLDEGIKRFNNWNDRFRDLIRYANHLHSEGKLDGIIATGDIVDYGYEKGGNKNGGGNFDFLIQLIRGKSKYPFAERKHEELKVPIFTSLGNHDYRPNPYYLLAELTVGWGSIDLKTIKQFSNFNLELDEASAIQDGRKPQMLPQAFGGYTDFGKIKIDSDQGFEMIEVEDPTYYFKYLSKEKSYVVQLGEHRLVMLDSGPDIGLPEDILDAIKLYLGLGSEDEQTTAAGHPVTRGLDQGDIRLLEKALQETKPDGLVIVGTHSPPINPKGTEYPHYFRETEHDTADPLEVANYLRRRVPLVALGSGAELTDGLLLSYAKKFQPDWPLTNTTYFKTGSHSNLLDWGVSRGEVEKFLEICAGVKDEKRVDLVLFGHIHTRAEMRLKWQNCKMEYYHDYYTQNPDYYYASRKYTDKPNLLRKSRLEVWNGVEPNGSPYKDETTKLWHLSIPPYSNPLDRSQNPKEWWDKHKPLFIQGAPLGPMDNRQRSTYPEPNFQGCKLITVKNNVIHRIVQVPTHQISIIEPKENQWYYIQPKVSHFNLQIPEKLSWQESAPIELGRSITESLSEQERASIEPDQSKTEKVGEGNQIWRLEKVPETSGYYYIVSAFGNNRCLSVKAASKTAGALIVQTSKQRIGEKRFAQHWLLEPTGDGYYYLFNRYSRMLLDVKDASKKIGASIWQYPFNETPAQKWRFLEIEKFSWSYVPPVTKRPYFLKPKINKELSLDVKGGSTAENAAIIQWDHHGLGNQTWYLEQVAGHQNYFYIACQKSRKCLMPLNASRKVATPIVQATKRLGNSPFAQTQQWVLQLAADESYYFLMNRYTQLNLDVRGGANTRGTIIWQYTRNHTDAQKWHFVVKEF